LLQTGWKAALTALGEFASPHADHGAIFGQTVFIAATTSSANAI
jgi:hypothetical protein